MENLNRFANPTSWPRETLTGGSGLSAEFYRALRAKPRPAAIRPTRLAVSAPRVSLAPPATCPAAIGETVRGFSRHQQTIASLPPLEQAKIGALAQAIRASHRPGCLPVKVVWLIGHADKDPQAGAQFEQKISSDRALRLQEALIKAINDPAMSGAITWVAAGAGATQPEVRRATTEADRAKNRRVQILTTPTPLGVEAQIELVFRYIQLSAAAKAADTSLTVAGSNFAGVVRRRYMDPFGYLTQPATDRAQKVIEKIGAQNTSGKMRPVCGVIDMWERATPLFNSIIPPALQAQIKKIPQLAALLSNIGAATEILRIENRRQMSVIDVPFLLGENTIPWFDCVKTKKMGVDREHDSDLQFQNSKNESQLMHWATGVRYSHLSRETLRDLFLAYEKWHLEYLDVFGPDPLNDMIAEEAGRFMAEQIRGLKMNAANYIRTLDESFRQARAWVGALLRLQRSEIDAQIKAEIAPAAHIHWIFVPPVTADDQKHHPYPAPSIRRMLAAGAALPKVLTSPVVLHYIELYTLLFEVDLWEKSNGSVSITPAQQAMVTHLLDNQFQALAILEKKLGETPVSLRLKRLPQPRAVNAEFGVLPYRCTPCLLGHKICHEKIVPDDGSCRWLFDEYYDCRC